MIRQTLGISVMSFAIAAGVAVAVAPQAAADSYCGVSSSGARVFAGPNTSCGFALNTAEASRGFSGSFNVHSPQTGDIYTMTCAGGVCRGGNGAFVAMY